MSAELRVGDEVSGRVVTAVHDGAASPIPPGKVRARCLACGDERAHWVCNIREHRCGKCRVTMPSGGTRRREDGR